MDPNVNEATLLYVTDRPEFYRRYGRNGLVHGLMDEIFLESESRPDLAERITVASLGYIPTTGKKGYDGHTRDGRPIEVKVRNFVSKDSDWPRKQTSISINDVSWYIVERFVNDNPMILISYFYDGHMAAIFELDYCQIHRYYIDCLQRPQQGRCSFVLNVGDWMELAWPVYLHKDPAVVRLLPQSIRKEFCLDADDYLTLWQCASTIDKLETAIGQTDYLNKGEGI